VQYARMQFHRQLGGVKHEENWAQKLIDIVGVAQNIKCAMAHIYRPSNLYKPQTQSCTVVLRLPKGIGFPDLY
jgi:hypothetical protein